MRLSTRRVAGRAIVAATTTVLLAAPLALTTTSAEAETSEPARPALKVMTRNLYLGVDIMRPLDALADLEDQLDPDHNDPNVPSQAQILGTLAMATDTARDIVDDTDFATRAKLLAEEIATASPDLVGLQEVAMWRSGPLDLLNVAVPDATTVDYDWLTMLRAELKAQGVPYRPVSVNWLSDVEAPAFSANPASPDARDVRLTMRDVILKRVGSPVKVLRHQERSYDDGLVVEIAGKTLDFRRGYQWVDAELGGKRFRFINTHLEAFSSDMAYKQMQQMLEGPASRAKTTVIACDCNSDPLNQSVKPVDTLPHSEPYWLATGEHEFFDTWLQHKPARFGWTSGLSETVDDATPAGFDHRIDLILARRGDGGPLRVLGGQVTGDELGDRDPTTGLWPSDHAGVVMRLRGL